MTLFFASSHLGAHVSHSGINGNHALHDDHRCEHYLYHRDSAYMGRNCCLNFISDFDVVFIQRLP
jgi:hypothetical protein